MNIIYNISMLLRFRNKKWLLLFFIMKSLSAISQTDYDYFQMDNIAPSISQFHTLNHFPAPLCNGKVDIEIPLLTLKYNNIKIPVSMLYRTDGIKVKSVSSRVGANWFIQPQGIVTRTIRGSLYDFMDETECLGTVKFFGWQHHDFTNNNEIPPLVCSSHQNVTYDMEPDLFTVSAPGLYCSFYINKSNTGVIESGDNAKINIDVDIAGNSIDKIVIFNEQGIKYTFGHKGEEYIAYSYNCTSYTTFGYVPSNWYLTEMIYPTGENIIFNYDNTTDDFVWYSKSNGTKDVCNDCNIYYSYLQPDDIILDYPYGTWNMDKVALLEPTRLTEVILPNCKLKFEYDEERDDITDFSSHALTSLILEDYNSVIRKKYTFEYDYLTDQQGNPTKLILDKLNQNNILTADEKTFDFVYYSGFFPSYKSFKYDYLGYYSDNGQINSSQKLYAYFSENLSNVRYLPQNVSTSYSQTIFSGNDRTPSISDAIIGALQKIKYPTGGEVLLEYESNRASFLNKEIDVPGLRVKSQTIKHGDQNIVKNYVYSMYSSSFPRFAYLARLPEADIDTEPERISHIQNYTTKSEDNLSNISMFNGSTFLYQEVREITQNNGEVLYYFYTNKDESINGTLTSSSLTQENKLSINPVNKWPFFREKSNKAIRGKLAQKYYINQEGMVEKGYLYKYGFMNYNNSNQLVGKQIIYQQSLGTCNYGTPDDYIIYRYTLPSRKLLLKSEYIIDFNSNLNPELEQLGNNILIDKLEDGTSSWYDEDYIISEMKYNYNDNLKINYSRKNKSDGTFSFILYTYPWGNSIGNSQHFRLYPTSSEQDVLDNMLTINYQMPIEISYGYSSNGYLSTMKLLGGHHYRYIMKYNEHTNNNMYLKRKIDRFVYKDEVQQRFETEEFFSYDNYGNLNQYINKKGDIYSFIYGNDQSRPIAKVNNMFYIDVKSNNNLNDSFAQLESFTNINSSNYLSLNNLNGTIRSFVPDSASVITYTYEPLWGQSSISNTKGTSKFFDYDGYGRLSTVKNDDGNIQKKYEYNYSNN